MGAAMRPRVAVTGPLVIHRSGKELIRDHRVRHKETNRIWRLLELDWPIGGEIAAAVAEYVTDAIPGAGTPPEPLLDEALCAALKRYDEDTDYPDDQRLRRLSDLLFDRLADGLAGIRVVSAHDDAVWLAEQGMPLGAWGDGRELDVRRRTAGDRDAVRKALQSYAVPDAYRQLLVEG